VAANFTISAIIKAVDKVTAPMGAIARKVEAVNAPIRRVNGAMRAMAQDPALGRISKGFHGLGVAAQNAQRHVTATIAPLLALATAGVATVLYQITKGFAASGAEVDDAAKKYNVAAQELQKLRYAAKLTGVEQGTLDNSLGRLSRSITVASKGAKDQANALRLLGYTDKQIASRKIDVGDATLRLAKRMEDERKAKSNAIIANALYGRSYLEMLPMLKAGSEEIARLTKEAEELGLVFDPRAAAEFDDASDRLNYSLLGLRNTIGSALLPIITPYLGALKDWIVANREIVASKVEEVLKNMNWEAIINGVKILGFVLLLVANNLDIVIGAFLAFKAIKIGVALWGVASAAGGLMVALGAPLVAAIGTVVAALKAGFTVMQALNLAMLMNPVGMFIAGITAVGAAAYLIYDNWEPIRDFFKNLLQGIVGFFEDAFDWILRKVTAVIDKIGGAISWIGRQLGIVSSETEAAAGAANRVTAGGMAMNRGASADGNQTAAAPTNFGGRGGSVNEAKANVTVDFRNAPQGTRVNSEVKGKGLKLGTDVGFQTGGSF